MLYDEDKDNYKLKIKYLKVIYGQCFYSPQGNTKPSLVSTRGCLSGILKVLHACHWY